MAERNNNAAAASTSGHETFKEAVCIDVARIYDSCSDKDCLEDLRVYFNDENQAIINKAFSVKSYDVEISNIYVDVEPVQFNHGFYSVDITMCFNIAVEVFDHPGSRACSKPCIVEGIAVFNKRVILYGSEGNVKVFSSTRKNQCDTSKVSKELPKAVVEAVDPIFLAARLIDADCACDGGCVPEAFSSNLNGELGRVKPMKIVLVTLGLFSIVRLERNVQMLVPAYDFCIPDKECETTSSDPCSLFKNIKFPVNEFFPPRFADSGDPSSAPDCGCGSLDK